MFHGSPRIVREPVFGAGNPRNDYGLGFYCTERTELAAEWACTEGRDGFVNIYHLDPEGLEVLRLLEPEYHVLNWLAVLLENRTVRLPSGNARSRSPKRETGITRVCARKEIDNETDTI